MRVDFATWREPAVSDSMHRPHLVAAAALALAAACTPPVLPHPLANQFRYTCCNLHYEKPEINDANYLRGEVIPFATRVQILAVRKDRVTFEAPGYPLITLALKYGAPHLTMEQYLARIFVMDDPYLRLAKLPGDGKQAIEVERTRHMIEEGTVSIGMTRDQVLMTLGYPPADRTPSLDAPRWTYWANRGDPFEVFFEGDRVSRVSRPEAGGGGRRRRRG